jgi:hypothetical protein
MKCVIVCCLCLFLIFGTALAKKSDNSEQMTVRGCLRRDHQNYVVVDRHGWPYVLKGVGNKVDAEVGHEVEVKGKLSEDVKSGVRPEKQGSNPADTVRAVDGATVEILNVSTDIRRVSDTCSSH